MMHLLSNSRCPDGFKAEFCGVVDADGRPLRFTSAPDTGTTTAAIRATGPLSWCRRQSWNHCIMEQLPSVW
jgi:hypothetical protein